MSRVLYIGNFEPDHSTENDVRRAFEHLGWEVDRWQERDFIAATQSSWRGALSAKLLDTPGEPWDLLLHTMTQGNYPPDSVLAMWDWFRSQGIPTASIHLDRFYGLASPKDSGPQRCDLPRLHPMFKVDHVFTADGDSDELFARDGVNHHWLPPAVRFDEARDIEPTDEDRAKYGRFDVGFCGARGYHPEHDRAGLVDALAEHFGDRFVRVAGDTPYGTVRGEALNRMYATVPVWVGDSCFAGTSSRYCSDRFFETWGRGGVLIFPHLQGIVDLTSEPGYGYEPLSWSPYEDRRAMLNAVEDYLAHRSWHAGTVRYMRRTVREKHTYVDRVQEMLDVIGFAKGSFAHGGVG